MQMINALILLVLSTFIIAQENLEKEAKMTTEAGVVISTNGALTASNDKGEVRTLTRKSPFYVNETLNTGVNSRAQLRFKDNALMTLKPNTELKIADFHFDGDKNPDNKSFMELVSGGFRTLSGAIGKLNESAYRIDTPAASIGIRGTDYEIIISHEGTVFAAVHDGGILLVNNLGNLNIGKDSEFLFAEVIPGRAPVGLRSYPELFNEVENDKKRTLSPEEKAALRERLETFKENREPRERYRDSDGAFDFKNIRDDGFRSGGFDKLNSR